MNKILAFTGHRSLPSGQKLSQLEKTLAKEIELAINGGYDTFMFGGAIGFDMLCANMVAVYKKAYPIKLIAVIPYKNQADKWSTSDKQNYKHLLSTCDEVITLSEHYHTDCYKNRNQYMVDRATKLIAYYDGGQRSGTGQTVRMAQRKNITITNLY